MRVAFRADASTRVGLGHVGRCAALAQALHRLGAQTKFVTRRQDLDIADFLATRGLEVEFLTGDVEDDAHETLAALGAEQYDWVVVDHYQLDRRWHEAVEAQNRRVCVIDDLANRPLRGDLLVDHNPSADHRAKYGVHAEEIHRLLGGPRFALLAPVYADAPRYEFDRNVRSIGIFMGGTDPLGLSQLALRACREVAGFTGHVEIASTSANPNLGPLHDLAASMPPASVCVDLRDLAGFFRRHDLQIGAAGGATWERCCIGAPSVAVAWADNHAVVLGALDSLGVSRACWTPAIGELGRLIGSLVDDEESRRAMSLSSRALVDGRGAERVALSLCASQVALRPAAIEDAETAYRWRNDQRTFRFFRHPEPVSWISHRQWWSNAIADESRRLLVAQCGSRDVGSIRFDFSEDAAEISIYLDPELTGLGLGGAMLAVAQAWLASFCPQVNRVIAEVLPNNVASANTFRAAGFAQQSTTLWVWEARS